MRDKLNASAVEQQSGHACPCMIAGAIKYIDKLHDEFGLDLNTWMYDHATVAELYRQMALARKEACLCPDRGAQ